MSRGESRRVLGEKDFTRLHPKLIQLFFRLGLTVEAARDLTQETFLQVCKSLDTFEDRSELDTWVLSVAKRVWLKSLRSRRAQKRDADVISVSGEAGAEDLPLASPGFERQVLTQDLLDRVAEAIRQLPAAMRDSLVLYARGTKYREIAVHLGMTESRVASLIHQARAKLRREFT